MGVRFCKRTLRGLVLDQPLNHQGNILVNNRSADGADTTGERIADVLEEGNDLSLSGVLLEILLNRGND